MTYRLGAAVAAAVALAAAGCGGNAGAGAPDGANVAPASAAAFIWVNTDLKSGQWQTAKRLLRKFPGRAKLLAQINKELAKQNLDFDRDVKPALGSEIDVVWLDFANGGNDVVGLTKPRDRQKFDQLLKADPKNPLVSAQVSGWTVFSDKQALLDQFRSAAGGKALADDDAFSQAFGRLDDNSIARAYVSGTALEQAWERSFSSSSVPLKPQDFFTFGPIVAEAKAASNGARIDADAEVHVGLKPDPTPDPYDAKLPSELPAGALLYVSYSQLDKEARATLNQLSKALPSFDQQRAQAESALGTSLDKDVLPLLSGEAAFAIYGGTPFPTFEFVLAVKDEQKARRLLEKLNSLLAFSGSVMPRTVTVAGVRVEELKIPGQAFTLDYAIFDHKLVIENGRAGIMALKKGGTKLADDPLYKAAQSGAGASGKTIGFVYANLQDGLPVAFQYARRTGSVVPPDAAANTKPLESAIFSFTRDGDHFKGTGFTGIK